MHKAAFVRFAPVCLAAALTFGCGDDDDDDFDRNFLSSLTGDYSGQIDDSAAGRGTLDLSISQTGSTFSGTFSTSFANPAFDDDGIVTGSIMGNDLNLTLDSVGASACDFTATAQRVSEDRIVGDFQTTADCVDDEGGTFDIDR